MHRLTGHMLPICVIGVLLLHYSTAQNEDHYDDYEDEDDDYEDDDFHVLKTYLANGHYQDPFTRPVPGAACFSPSLWLLHSLLLIQLCRLIFV